MLSQPHSPIGFAPGRKNGDWKGNGIISSAAGQDNKKITGVAIAANDKGGGVPLYSTYFGFPLTKNDILLKYTYNGDTDLNGKIDADDFFQTDNGFALKSPGYRNGDFDFNGVIDADDYFLVDNAFVQQSGTLSAAAEAARPSVVKKHARAEHHHARRLAKSRR